MQVLKAEWKVFLLPKKRGDFEHLNIMAKNRELQIIHCLRLLFESNYRAQKSVKETE